MTVICPTILARNAHAYRTQTERLAPFAHRVQIDLTDGIFAKRQTVLPAQVWWPVGVKADIHVMYKEPLKVLDQLIALNPHMVIVHAEAEGSFDEMEARLRQAKIKIGVALLQPTTVQTVLPVLSQIDHVLIFSGDLGSYGGTADLSLLRKVTELQGNRPELEIGWDGGITKENIRQLARGGVDVLNVGSFIQRAENPEAAYDTLRAVIR